ncbi:MAG TPA: 7TM diverse intracellular signaling domain-containing protein, partial [Spirochaetia bacterium]|nr:7TM diverse intracellular signaling domain-containing protein [Spirochaetia bacterium]
MRLPILLALALAAPSLEGLAPGPLVGAPATSTLSWSVDPQGSWTWDEAWARSPNFTKERVTHRSFGYTDKVYWLRFDWERPWPDDRDLFLVFWEAQIDHFDVQFHNEHGGGPVHHLGDSDPPDPGGSQTRWPTVPWPSEASGSVLVRMESTNSLHFEPLVYDRNSLTSIEVGTYLGTGFIAGFLFLMILFNTFMVRTTRDPLYLWYTTYLVTVLVYVTVYTGILNGPLPALRAIQNAVDVPLEALTVVTAMLFAYQANRFGEKKRGPWFAGVVIGVAVLGTLVHVGGQHRIALQVVHTSLILLAVGVEVETILLARAGRRMSQFFVVAWTGLLASSVLVILASWNVVGQVINLVGTSVAMMLGLLVETTVLSAALADRVRVMQNEVDRYRDQVAVSERLTTVGLLTARLGHEVNSPNHVIGLSVSFLDGLQRKLLETLLRSREDGTDEQETLRLLVEEATPRIQAIRMASGQIAQVVTDLRARAPESPTLTVCDLGALLAHTGRLYEVKWREQCSRLSIQPPLVEALVWGREFRLQQLMVNLTTNALEALGSKDRAVTVA